MACEGKVLVVEDDVDVRTVVTEVLGEEGFDVVCANDGQEALELLGAQEATPAVVVLDLDLPRLCGAELLVAARALVPGFADVPVIVMSGMGPGDPRPPLPGVRAWLDKPFELEELVYALLSASARAPEPANRVRARRVLRHLERHGDLAALRDALGREDLATVGAITARLCAVGEHFGLGGLVSASQAIASAAAGHNVAGVTAGLRALADVVLGLQVRH